MTSRERILMVLRGDQPDRIPWIPLCSWTYFSSLPDYKKFIVDGHWAVGEEFMGDALRFRVDFYKHQIGADFMDWCALPPYCVKMPNVKETRVEKGDVIYTEYRTPVGTLTCEEGYSEEAHTTFPRKDILEGGEDFRAYQYLVEDTVYEPDYDDLTRRMEIVGEDGVQFIHAPAPPLKRLLLHDMRLDKAFFALQDYKVKFERLLKTIHEKNLEVCRLLADSPGLVFMDGAVTGTGMISPQIFEEYYLLPTQEYVEIFHEKGKFYLNHASGEPVGPILDLVIETGIDGLYGLSYPPSGDLKISEVRRRLQNRIAVMGGIDSDFIATSRPDKIRKQTEYVLDEATPGDHFMLGTADDTPYGTSVRNLRAVSEAVQEFGRLSFEARC